MLKQLVKILQEKYPKLLIAHHQERIHVTNVYWLMTIYPDYIIHPTGVYQPDLSSVKIFTNMNDPNYLQEIDKIIKDGRLLLTQSKLFVLAHCEHH